MLSEYINDYFFTKNLNNITQLKIKFIECPLRVKPYLKIQNKNELV